MGVSTNNDLWWPFDNLLCCRAGLDTGGPAMTEESYEQKLAEVDNFINDPNRPLCPARIWQLVGETCTSDLVRRLGSTRIAACALRQQAGCLS
jgi:hypothetical protein